MALGKRIKVAREKRDLTQLELAERVGGGCKAQTIQALEQRDSVRSAYAGAIARVLRVRLEWLTTGEEPMEIAFSNTQPAQIESRQIPIISYVQAGLWKEISDPYPVGSGQEMILVDASLGDGIFALRIKGKSMLPEFHEGDIVIIDPSVPPLPGDLVVAKNGEEEATFKKYRPRGQDAQGNTIVELVPFNEDFPSLRSDIQPFVIVGTMIEHRRPRRR